MGGLNETTVFFIGASNVSQEAAYLADIMGFRTVAVDFEEAALSEERFPRSERVLVDDMAQMPDLGVTERDMICVITRGHTFDRQCFTWALGQDAFYVGMMGSAKKNAKCFAYALEQGVSQDRIDWSNTPIGIDMPCFDAREIALSIVAELVKERNERFPRVLDHDLLHQE